METTDAISQYELERGKPMPRRKHGIVQARLTGQLLRYEDRFDIMSEIDVSIENKLYTPDVCVYPKSPIDWTAEETPMATPPVVAIEIISQSQSIETLIQKAEVYLSAGTAAVWLVIPSLQAIFVLLPNIKPIPYTSGILKDHSTGIEILIDDVFR
jgi:Uma2 family endonuclease